jgi:exonuclease VII large subunit
VGTLVEVEGNVSRVEGFSSGLYVYITDDTDEVQLLLWQNVADRVPDGEKLVAGARVRAAGEVGEYKGTLQVVPRLPFDVEVLR